MTRLVICSASAVLLMLLNQPLAHAQDQSSAWKFSGSNELLVENYDVSGDPTLSPFRLEGTFLTNRLNLNVAWTDRQLRAFVLRAEIAATDNDYLPEQGLVVATMAMKFEDGRAALPYRVEVGDVFADLSRRLLQRQLRGMSVEIQPRFGSGTHSLLLVTGSGAPDWRDTFRNGGDLYFTAASWLWQSSSETTSIVANLATESARAGAEGAFPRPASDRDQILTGVSAKTKWRDAEIEGEMSLLDPREGATATSFYGEVSRTQGPLHWRIRYEDNDEDYLALGAMGIIAGRSIAELHGRWRTSPRSLVRSSIRGRLQKSEQRLAESEREIATDTAGLTWESQPIRSRPTFRSEAMADVSRIESNDDLQDLIFRTLGVELRDEIGVLDVSWRGSIRDLDDRARPAFDRRATGQELVAGRNLRLGEWTARVGGGIGHRRSRAGVSSFDSWSPVVDASIRNGNHLVRFYYGLVDQRYRSALVDDLRYQNRRILYTYGGRNHQLTFELGEEMRQPEHDLSTDSRRVALRYRYTFDKNL